MPDSRTGLFPNLSGSSPAGGAAEASAKAQPASNPSERDRLLDEAIAAGKILPESRSQYAAQYDRDPAGTRNLLARLGSGVIKRDDKSIVGGSGTGLFPRLNRD